VKFQLPEIKFSFIWVDLNDPHKERKLIIGLVVAQNSQEHRDIVLLRSQFNRNFTIR
jgi:hypothetical protein